ncbi:protein tify 6b [Phtheirospermum japonicum]|uniref:Protein TIFY n=1 Tax=Phtheirospermum japonicum TaxID=374723 RepID=A0A830BE54_9LAMI|nr:protein tify 6b [Phtheirospermum japonicum]
MERDFLGLNYKDPIVMKDEFVDGGCVDSGFARSSGVAWPWLNKTSQLMSLKNDQNEKILKLKSDLLASHAYMAKPSSDMFEAMHKRQSGDIIENGAVPIHDVSMMSSFLKPHFANFGGANNNNNMKQQFLGGLFAPSPVPPSAEEWNNNNNNNNSKAPSSPTQLTIFYGGTVNVFDDITPEKAQAIIFLAGNGCVSPSNMAQSKLEMPPPLSSPMSDSCFPVDRSGNNGDVMVLSKTAGMSTSKVEPPRMILPIRSVAASNMLSSAVPQARKASLARFLEKRKERATNAAPYNLNKNGTDDTTQESNDFGFSASSGV